MSKIFIKMSGFDRNDGPYEVESQYDWPVDTYLQGGGKGIVLSSDGSYTTAFVEAFIRDGQPNPGFYRGEGSSVKEAEDAVYSKYVAGLACEEHEFEARGYKNGAAFCKLCNYFKSGHYSAEDLGRFCYICNVPTYDEFYILVDGEVREEILCSPHYKESSAIVKKHLLSLDSLTTEQERILSFVKFLDGTEFDDDSLVCIICGKNGAEYSHIMMDGEPSYLPVCSKDLLTELIVYKDYLLSLGVLTREQQDNLFSTMISIVFSD